jgi:hypothetical protein
MAATSQHPNATPRSTFLLVPLSTVTACGLSLQPELRIAGLDDADAVRLALRRRDREVRS